MPRKNLKTKLMKIEHLEERVLDYKTSIKQVVDKKMHWNAITKPLLIEILKQITTKYKIGWKMQELNWIHNSEAINITFDSFPPELIDCTNSVPSFQFIPGGSLVFSQTYSGDVFIFVLFPLIDSEENVENILELGLINPADMDEKMIIEKVEEFLKEMIKWELPNTRKKVGYN